MSKKNVDDRLKNLHKSKRNWTSLENKMCVTMLENGKTNEYIGRKLNRTLKAIDFRRSAYIYITIKNKRKSVRRLAIIMNLSDDDIKSLYKKESKRLKINKK